MTIASSCLLATLLGAPLPAPEPADPPALARRFDVVSLSTEGIDQSSLVAALALRVRELRVRDHQWPSHDDAPFVYVGVRADADGYAITVITQEGAAYERRVVATPTELDQALATTIANLLHSIEEDAIMPDRDQVPMPPSNPATETVPRVPIEPERPSNAPAAAAPIRRRVPAARWQGDVGLAMGAWFAAGSPTASSPLAAWGGALGFAAVAPSSALIEGDMRVATRGAALSSRVVRFRVGLGGGYLWKLGRVRLWLSALVSVEPWFVRQGSDAGQLRRDGRDARPGVLLGGSLRFSPSYQIRLGRGDGGGLSLGPRLELAGSGSPDGGIASVAAASPDGGTRPLFRVGGLELGVSFELRGQFDLGDH